MTLSLIFATDRNFGIGKNGEIPWHKDPMVRKEDLNWFKSHTTGNVVIMGRKTWESLGCKPLPNRQNVVISRNPVEKNDKVDWCETPEESLLLYPERDNYVIGGAIIYNYFLNNLADKIDVIIHSKLFTDLVFDCDSKICRISYNNFFYNFDVKVEQKNTYIFENTTATKILWS